jgi:carboxymethylenebutenolidase
MTEAVTQLDIDQRVFDLYDEYCHGRIDRREFLRRAALVAGGLAMAQALLPRGGNSGQMRGYLLQPRGRGRSRRYW